jgi:YgiT-type zinc finger domain-containing protein
MTWDDEKLVEQKVTYTLLKDGRLYVVEHVPARVNPETGEQFFAPETVEHLHHLILESARPTRVIETPVYEYA